MNSPNDGSGRLSGVLAIALGLAGYLFWIGSGAWHLVLWLRNGVWPRSMTLIEALLVLVSPSRFADWLISPDSWIGLHEIVGWLSVQSAALLVAITASIYLSVGAQN